MPGLPLITAFFAPAEAFTAGTVGVALWVALLVRRDAMPRDTRRVLFLVGAVAGLAWVLVFVFWDWR